MNDRFRRTGRTTKILINALKIAMNTDHNINVFVMTNSIQHANALLNQTMDILKDSKFDISNINLLYGFNTLLFNTGQFQGSRIVFKHSFNSEQAFLRGLRHVHILYDHCFDFKLKHTRSIK